MAPYSESKTKFDPIKLLSQAFAYFKHVRLMLIMVALGLLAGMCYFTYTIPLYQARSLVYFQSFGSAVRDTELQETVDTPSRVTRSLLTQLASRQIKIGAAKRMGLLDETTTSEALAEHIANVRVDLADLRHFEITVQAYDPEIVRNYCKAMVEEFQDFQQNTWKEFRDDALERYAVQLVELEEKVSESIDSLSDLEREKQFAEITIEQQSLLQIPKQIVEIKERLTRMAAIRKTLEKFETRSEEADDELSILSLLSSYENDTIVGVGDILRTPGLGKSPLQATVAADIKIVQPSDIEGIEHWRKLEKDKRILESQIAEASETFLPDHPQMKELTESLEETKRALTTEMLVLREKFDLEYERLEEKLPQLEARLPEYYAVTQELGKSSQAYSIIEQSQKMWDDSRARLAQKLATVTFSEEFDWIQLRFKGHTSLRDKNPISPSKSKLIMLSAVLGLAGAFGVPTILNLLDTSASTVHQLEDDLGIPGLGIVPLSDRKLLEEVHRSPAQDAKIPNYLLECFRVIRSGICLTPGSSQVILVTSARPQEGKTTQAANLAWAFHSMGERTLLIDCDLRRGRVHDFLNLDNTNGVTRMLMGDVPPNEVIMNIGLRDFDVIPRGPVIAGTTELFCQPPFEKFVQKLRDNYDRIIFDCPPVLGLSESSFFQRLVDGTVLVIRSERTSRKDVRDALNLLEKSDARVFGFVLNGVDLSKIGNYYNYYYYSATYYDHLESEDIEVEKRRSRARPSESNEIQVS